ncbi:bifunctional homocysteine S-methyltransferase/methylenetetrahydrofolate reductase [Bacillus taeanensis]|uniref:Bifunctional homocysteine S-methyltransferase/methylenetetrahydrofolate reductase n=1 Tax=Bacillus taeanensis TaxID=273032 RepID=A0A366XYT4_9BACI|nr:bifunctional homocysteine S-methyltransferase/methylenetetrahydrofolate reductase [Bacillus taeanensis]RBW70305.1 bifunctional homocysteine S-methyltransferase/methylenetetrahydrofolate reductase [Bacillus taeanensis]
MSLLDKLRHSILVGDGAIGTLLYSYGIDQCFEHLNLTHEKEIYNIHKSYIEAGANVIQTNTYGANSIKLARYGLEDEVVQINKKAAQIAKAAAEDRAFVVGTIGGIRGIQKNAYSITEIEQAFKQQLLALLGEEPDGILLETYYDLEELKAVLKIVKNETTIPVIAQVSLHDPSVLQSGISLKEALQQLADAGADVVGVNCRLGPTHMIQALEEVPLSDGVYLSAYPNASLPDIVDGQFTYNSDPNYFEQAAVHLKEQGVRLIGGCCGTTPEHIKAIIRGLKDRQPVLKKDIKKKSHRFDIVKKERTEKPLHEIVRERPSVIVELDPPKQLNIDKFIEGTKALHHAGVDAVTMADNSLATPRISNMAMSVRIKEASKARPLVHITCRDRNLIGLQSHLLGLHTLGINEVLAVTGDPTKLGGFPGATSVYDLSSYDLIQFIKQLNEGVSFSGKSLGEKTSFSVAAAFNPNVRHVDRAVKRLEKKIECGADYFMSQPLFSEEKIIETYEATKHLSTPIYIGIMPLTGTRNAEFLHHEVPGITLTDETRRRMAVCDGDPTKTREESIAIAKPLIDTALKYFNGIYLITPFMRYDLTVELTNYIHEKTKHSKVNQVVQ